MTQVLFVTVPNQSTRQQFQESLLVCMLSEGSFALPQLGTACLQIYQNEGFWDQNYLMRATFMRNNRVQSIWSYRYQ